jgi:hypothetical protein
MTTININININSSTNEMALNMFRANFAHNVKVMHDLMINMVDKVMGDDKFMRASCRPENKDLDLLWNMFDKKVDELIKENRAKTNEVRALFKSESGVQQSFFDFVYGPAHLEMLKDVPNGINAFVKCAMILNEHYERFAKKVEDFTVNGMSLVNMANYTAQLRDMGTAARRLGL